VREEKRLYDEQMAEAIREAELAVIRMERRRAEAEQEKAEQRRKRARKLAQDTKRLLEAAYEGRSSEVQKLLEGGVPVSAHNQNGTTALSEVVQILLEHGGDPRLHDNEACTPIDVGKGDGVLAKLRAWDVEETDEIIAEYEFRCEAERLQQQRVQQQEMQSIDVEFEQATTAHEAAQAALARAKRSFREREKEHGLGLAAGHTTAVMACASASDHLDAAEATARAAQAKLDDVNRRRLEAAERCGALMQAPPGRNVFIPDLNSVLIRDISGRITKGSRWPLIIDPSECANKLLQYSGCSVLCFWRADEMTADRIRKALLCMIRGGGVLAVNLVCFSGGVDLELLAEPFEQVRPGLFADIMSRAILSPSPGKHRPMFLDLVQADEKRQFSIEHFDERCTSRFKFFVLSEAETPHRQLLEAFDVLRVRAVGEV